MQGLGFSEGSGFRVEGLGFSEASGFRVLWLSKL